MHTDIAFEWKMRCFCCIFLLFWVFWLGLRHDNKRMIYEKEEKDIRKIYKLKRQKQSWLQQVEHSRLYVSKNIPLRSTSSGISS